jgi:predicted O-methyltransferase YrrM
MTGPLTVLAKYLHVPEGDAGGWVTYRPSLARALLWALEQTTNADDNVRVLELGTGVGSSPMLAAMAVSCDWIRVTAVETDPKWYAEVAKPLANFSYDPLTAFEADDLASMRFDVVFVDHGPVEARARDLALLAKNPNVGLVVVHDWNVDVYGYDKSIFKYRVEDRGRFPNTAILSNTVDLSDWLGYER